MSQCSYCTSTHTLLCLDCQQFFCHSFLGTVSSHIVFHLKKSGHTRVAARIGMENEMQVEHSMEYKGDGTDTYDSTNIHNLTSAVTHDDEVRVLHCPCGQSDVFKLGVLPHAPTLIRCLNCVSYAQPLIQDRSFNALFRESEEEESTSSSEPLEDHSSEAYNNYHHGNTHSSYVNTDSPKQVEDKLKHFSLTQPVDNKERGTRKTDDEGSVPSNKKKKQVPARPEKQRLIIFTDRNDYCSQFLRMLRKEHLIDRLLREQLSQQFVQVEKRQNRIIIQNRGNIGDEVQIEILARRAGGHMEEKTNGLEKINVTEKIPGRGVKNNLQHGQLNNLQHGHLNRGQLNNLQHGQLNNLQHGQLNKGQSNNLQHGQLNNRGVTISNGANGTIQIGSQLSNRPGTEPVETAIPAYTMNDFYISHIIKAFIVNDTLSHTIAELSQLTPLVAHPLPDGTYLAHVHFPFRNISYSRIKRALNVFVKKDNGIVKEILLVDGGGAKPTDGDRAVHRESALHRESSYNTNVTHKGIGSHPSPYKPGSRSTETVGHKDRPYELLVKELLQSPTEPLLESSSLAESLRRAVDDRGRNGSDYKGVSSDYHKGVSSDQRITSDQRTISDHKAVTSEPSGSHMADGTNSYMLFQPPTLPPLNNPQLFAISYSLQHPITLIQGPPGTGKTITSVGCVYNHYYIDNYHGDTGGKSMNGQASHHIDNTEKNTGHDQEGNRTTYTVTVRKREPCVDTCCLRNKGDGGSREKHRGNKMEKHRGSKMEKCKYAGPREVNTSDTPHSVISADPSQPGGPTTTHSDENTLPHLHPITFLSDMSPASFYQHFHCLLQYRKQEPKILMTAPSNIAVDNMAKKMWEIFGGHSRSDYRGECTNYKGVSSDYKRENTDYKGVSSDRISSDLKGISSHYKVTTPKAVTSDRISSELKGISSDRISSDSNTFGANYKTDPGANKEDGAVSSHVYIPSYFNRPPTPLLRIVSRNREGLPTSMDMFTLHSLAESMAREMVEYYHNGECATTTCDSTRPFKKTPSNARSHVERIVEWLTLCEIYSQVDGSKWLREKIAQMWERWVQCIVEQMRHTYSGAPPYNDTPPYNAVTSTTAHINNTGVYPNATYPNNPYSTDNLLNTAIRQYLLLRSSIIICTLVTSGNQLLHKLIFDLVLVDEAVQAHEPMTLIPLCHETRRMVLVGDHKQLGPTVVSDSRKFRQCCCGDHLVENKGNGGLRGSLSTGSGNKSNVSLNVGNKSNVNKSNVGSVDKLGVSSSTTGNKSNVGNKSIVNKSNVGNKSIGNKNSSSTDTLCSETTNKTSDSIGDSATVLCKVCSVSTTPLRRSLFERLLLRHIPILLTVQYRMDPILCEFVNKMFYGGRLRTWHYEGTGTNAVGTRMGGKSRLDNRSSYSSRSSYGHNTRQNMESIYPTLFLPKTFFYNSPFTEEPCGMSFLNRQEALVILRIVQYLKRSGVQNTDIGIVTPYEGQRNYLNQLINTNGFERDYKGAGTRNSVDSKTNMDYKDVGSRTNYDREYKGAATNIDHNSVDVLLDEIEIANVDAFQGREKQFILISLVRSNNRHEIGFLRNKRRMNVALTRARQGCYLVGDVRTYYYGRRGRGRGYTPWHTLIDWFITKQLLVEGEIENLRSVTGKEVVFEQLVRNRGRIGV